MSIEQHTILTKAVMQQPANPSGNIINGVPIPESARHAPQQLAKSLKNLAYSCRAGAKQHEGVQKGHLPLSQQAAMVDRCDVLLREAVSSTIHAKATSRSPSPRYNATGNNSPKASQNNVPEETPSDIAGTTAVFGKLRRFVGAEGNMVVKAPECGTNHQVSFATLAGALEQTTHALDEARHELLRSWSHCVQSPMKPYLPKQQSAFDPVVPLNFEKE